MPKPEQVIIDPIEHDDWVIDGWKIQFLLADRLLHQIRLLTVVDNWFDDPILTDTWMIKLGICFNSIRRFYDTFGTIPQVGDRLFNEDSGMIVHDRSIDGGLKQITITLSL